MAGSEMAGSEYDTSRNLHPSHERKSGTRRRGCRVPEDQGHAKKDNRKPFSQKACCNEKTISRRSSRPCNQMCPRRNWPNRHRHPEGGRDANDQIGPLRRQLSAAARKRRLRRPIFRSTGRSHPAATNRIPCDPRTRDVDNDDIRLRTHWTDNPQKTDCQPIIARTTRTRQTRKLPSKKRSGRR